MSQEISEKLDEFNVPDDLLEHPEECLKDPRFVSRDPPSPMPWACHIVHSWVVLLVDPLRYSVTVIKICRRCGRIVKGWKVWPQRGGEVESSMLLIGWFRRDMRSG